MQGGHMALTIYTVGGNAADFDVEKNQRVMWLIYNVAEELGVHDDLVDLVVNGNILDKTKMLSKVRIPEDIPPPVVTAVVRLPPCGHRHCGVRKCTEA